MAVEDELEFAKVAMILEVACSVQPPKNDDGFTPEIARNIISNYQHIMSFTLEYLLQHQDSILGSDKKFVQ